MRGDHFGTPWRQTVIVQNRPMFGGNASPEFIRMIAWNAMRLSSPYLRHMAAQMQGFMKCAYTKESDYGYNRRRFRYARGACAGG